MFNSLFNQFRVTLFGVIQQKVCTQEKAILLTEQALVDVELNVLLVFWDTRVNLYQDSKLS